MVTTKLRRSDKSGFAHLIFIIIVALLVLGIAIFAFLKIRDANNSSSSSTSQSSSETATSQKDGNQTSGETQTKLELVGTPYYVHVPAGWDTLESKTYDLTEDGIPDGSLSKLQKSGWVVSFDANAGGYGGGPGCYLSTEESQPDLPKCPHYKLLSSTTLTDGYTFARIQIDRGDKPSEACAVMVDPQRLDIFKDNYPEADMWVCFSAISIVGSPQTQSNQAVSLRSTISKSSDDNILLSDTVDPIYLEAENILKSLTRS